LSNKKKPLPVLEGVEISDMAAEGKSLARINDWVVFVPYVAPGDVDQTTLRLQNEFYKESQDPQNTKTK